MGRGYLLQMLLDRTEQHWGISMTAKLLYCITCIICQHITVLQCREDTYIWSGVDGTFHGKKDAAPEAC